MMMDANGSMKLLRKLGACRDARAWAKGKTMRTIWDTCERGDWLRRLLNAIGYKWSPQARVEFDRIAAQEWAEYLRITAPARDSYKRITGQKWAEFDRSKPQAWAEYLRITAPARDEYDRIEAQAIRDLVEYPAELLRQAESY